jgi:glutaminyl-peptide cyclotransferase
VDDEYFAEGLALVDDHLVQITWKEGTAFVYDAETFDVIDELTYAGEGWGLCSDGERLVMSDGSATLTFRDPESFEATGRVEVTLDGGAVERLNELECVGDRVYANVYQTDRIVEIDPSTGAVTAVIDAAELTTAETNPDHDVLNGIAYDPATESFWLTGKWWENRYRVQFVPRTAEPTDVDGDRPRG